MGQITNQIRVLLQRVKMSGREPHKILMHQGIKEAFRTEIDKEGLVKPLLPSGKDSFDPIYHPLQGAEKNISFDGIPIVVDNSVTEILVQVKPRRYGEDEPIPNIDWKSINKIKRV